MSISLADFTNLLLTVEEKIKITQEEKRNLQKKLTALEEELSYMKGAHRYLNSVGPQGVKYGENIFTYAMTNKFGEYKEGNIVLKDQGKEEVGDILVEREIVWK